MRRDANPDFIEAVARGIDVICAFGDSRAAYSLSQISEGANLARPTARRVLITLEQLGYVRSFADRFELTPRVLELGLAYFSSTGIWEAAQAPLTDLSEEVGQSCSIAQLDGGDIVYVGRAAVPSLVTLDVRLGTRFPAYATSLGKAMLADMTAEQVTALLEQPSRSSVVPHWQPSRDALDGELTEVRARGWASSDGQLAPGVRSLAAPLRNADGRAAAALNINVNVSEIGVDDMIKRFVDPLLKTAAEISEHWRRFDALPHRAATKY